MATKMTFAFHPEVTKLLSLVNNTTYGNNDIFLDNLISSSAAASLSFSPLFIVSRSGHLHGRGLVSSFVALAMEADVPVSPRPPKAMRVVIKSWPRFAVPCIPDDVIFNILSRLPSKSVIRCKSVCKAWLAMISSQRFVTAHLELSKARPTILVVPRAYLDWEHEGMAALCMNFYRYNLGSEVELIHSEHFQKGIACWAQPVHCDGLILLSTQKEQIVLCNPAMREFITLPKASNSLRKIPKVGFGFDSCSNKYKAARFFYQMKSEIFEVVCRFEVLTLGTGIWRRTADPPYPIMGITPAHVRGSLYWRIDLPSPKHPKVFLQFNLAEEKFSLTPYPPCKAEPIYFVEFGDELCCACFAEPYEVVEIWILKNNESPTWTQYCTICIPQDIIVPLPGDFFKVPKVIFYLKDILLIRENKVYRYNIVTKEIKKLTEAVQDFCYYNSENNKCTIYLGKELACHAVNYVDSIVPVR
ncbi:hypothetical protein ACP70R_003001 [Stipagrostis hirtigluma subsp. patula]